MQEGFPEFSGREGNKSLGFSPDPIDGPAYISFFSLSLWPILCGHVHQVWKRSCGRRRPDGSRDGLTGVKHLKTVLPVTLRHDRRCLCAPLVTSVAPAEVSSLHSRISNRRISFYIRLCVVIVACVPLSTNVYVVSDGSE